MKCGIDIVDNARVEALILRHKRENLTRIWTEKELIDCTSLKGDLIYESLAARYACKEAFAKALGTGFGNEGIWAADIEILKHDGGEPYVVLYGKTKDFFEKCGYSEVAVSLTHANNIAAAICIIS